MKEQTNNLSKKRKIATTSMAILGMSLVIGGTLAALSDTFSHDESITVEWVEIVDDSDANLALEDVSDVTNTPVEELTPGITYELTGTLDNDSTVTTEWMATNLTTTPGVNVEIADINGEFPVGVNEPVDVSQFGITVTVDQTVNPSTDINFSIRFDATEARADVLSEPAAINEVFVDPVLATCVANDSELGANGDTNVVITQAQLDSISDLKCEGQNINSIDGLEYMHNLTRLELTNNNISDLTPLKHLTNLQHLDLSNNNITDITVLMNFTNLTYLNLGANNIEDLTPLENLTNLETLMLYENNISDITPLANLTNLTYLSIHVNEITDIAPIAGLTNLEYLYMSDNQISDISVLANFTHLIGINFNNNQITDISALAEITTLKEIGFRNNEISDITPLTNLTNLTYLDLNGNEITDITPLSNLMNLSTLFISGNHISDFSCLTYQPATFTANDQTIMLPETTHGTATPLELTGINGESLTITWINPGTYSNGELLWTDAGFNYLTFTSSDGNVSGTLTQRVNINH